MRNKKYIITVLLFLSGAAVCAQEVSQKSYYTFERIEDRTPWLVSANAAGLIFNAAPDNFSTAGGYYNYLSGGYRNYNVAEASDNMGLITKSYNKLNRLYLYGSFNYDYMIKKNQAWLGTIYENTHINPMLDSIPGKNLRESYNLNAKAAYKFSELFSAGITFNYNAATSAKRIDGRNRNTGSDLYISPGITFSTEYINAGVNLFYGYNAEQVDYSYLGDVTGKQLLYMEGLFMFSRSNIVNTMVDERRYQRNIFGGGVQLELKAGKFSFYNSFEAEYHKENDYEDNQLKKRYAVVNTTRYNYTGILRYSTSLMDNSLKITWISRDDLSYSVANVYEPVPGENNMWEYYEYGKSLRYASGLNMLGLEYKGFVKKNEYLSKIDFTLGFGYISTDKREKIYPAEYVQENKVLDYYAGVNKNFAFGNNLLGINLCGGYSGGSGKPLSETDPLTSGSLSINKPLLAYDYAYRVSDNYRIGGGVRYSYIVNREKGRTVSFSVNYLYRKLVKIKEDANAFYPGLACFGNNRRNSLNLSLSFNF